jgi:fumarate reductase flavoprotein subunit
MLRFPGHQVVAVFDHGTLVGSEPVVTGRTAEWLLDKAAVGLAVRKASSVSDLASLAGLDPAALSVTLERWNRQVAVGADSDFGRIGVLRPVVAPPYYAISLGVRVVASSGGPKTNTRQQVIDDNDRIIPGLFAAGEVTGYQGYGTGMFNTGCVVFGRQAGRMAASYALGRSLPLSP